MIINLTYDPNSVEDVFSWECEKLLSSPHFHYYLLNLVGWRAMILQMDNKNWFYSCDLCFLSKATHMMVLKCIFTHGFW